MSKNLVIVESPAKAKTIEKYLGSEFTVLSSVGHIRNIAKKNKDGTAPIDVKNDFKTTYEIDSEKKKTVVALRKAVKNASDVWLATDEDREGEAIAWHLCEVLNLDPKNTKRIVFHEITKSAIEEAIKNPRTVDLDLVKAQQARQILDRLVGFELSPVVWRKVPGGKSAGRVQSPAVRLLVEREREIDNFETSFWFKITAIFKHDKDELKSEVNKRFESESEARKFLESLLGAKFNISDVSTTPASRNPSAPFTTSTLQQEANSKLGFGSKATMSSAQKLYQEGKITYMRTDSTNLSGQAIANIKDFIISKYGEKYSHIRQFKTKNTNAQEAHEAIRPSDINLEIASNNEYEQKLYNLIRNRTIASQMSVAKLEKTTVVIDINNRPEHFEAKGEVVIFDGFLKVYANGKKDADILPPIKVNDDIKIESANARQVFSRAPARYTEGSLVKKLEDLGIGRPSTYATIINTVQVRGYAEKGDAEGDPRDLISLDFYKDKISRSIIQEKTGSNKGKLIPTASGQVVSDFLTNHFDSIVDYDFTASVEKHFDQIAIGELDRNKMLDDFYTPFHELIEKSGQIDRASVAQSREIGLDPKSARPIIARFGRYGPMLQMGNSDDEDIKPRFAPLPSGSKIETVTLDQALNMFKLPRIIGNTEDGSEIKANIGRFGPYIQVDKLFISIKPLDPHSISIKQALELYKEKLKSEAEKNINDFGDGIKVLKGRYGPYVTDGLKNVKIPKESDPRKITHIDAKELLSATPEPKKKRTKKKSVRKKTTTRIKK